MCVGLTSPSLLEQTHLSGGTQVSLHHTYIATTVISNIRDNLIHICAPWYPPPCNLRIIQHPEIFNKESIQGSSGQLSGYACPSVSFGFSRDQCDFDFVQVDTLKSHMMKAHRAQCRVAVEACPVVCRSLLLSLPRNV